MGDTPEPGAALLDRLVTAASRRDLDALAGCFAPGYRKRDPGPPGPGVHRPRSGATQLAADLHVYA